MLIRDDFPAPSIDTNYWTSTVSGAGVSLTVGVPIDGLYFQNVNAVGDEGYLDSDSKLIVPGVADFDSRIAYSGIYSDATESIVTHFGWYSLQQTALGNPLYGATVILCVYPGPQYYFQKSYINSGMLTRDNIKVDPLGGSSSGFRIVRTGTVYYLYYNDTGTGLWSLLNTTDLGYHGPGFVKFGVYAENPIYAFPWVIHI